DAPSVPRRQLIVACAFLACAIEIGRARNPASSCRFDEGFDQRVPLFDAADVQRTSGAVELIFLEIGIVFQFDEIGQDVATAPAVIAKLTPMVVIARLAADDNKTVDRA